MSLNFHICTIHDAFALALTLSSWASIAAESIDREMPSSRPLSLPTDVSRHSLMLQKSHRELYLPRGGECYHRR